jgi:hypothetical protein
VLWKLWCDMGAGGPVEVMRACAWCLEGDGEGWEMVKVVWALARPE